jgi:hypothetical protein
VRDKDSSGRSAIGPTEVCLRCSRDILAVKALGLSDLRFRGNVKQGVRDLRVGSGRPHSPLRRRCQSRPAECPPQPSPDRSNQADSSCWPASVVICRTIGTRLRDDPIQVQPRITVRLVNGAIVGIGSFVARISSFQSVPRRHGGLKHAPCASGTQPL